MTFTFQSLITNPYYNYLVLDKIPLIKNYFIDLENNVNKFGLSEGFNKFLKKLNSKTIIYNLSKENLDILQNKPVVVIATHPYLLEMFPAIGSLPNRKDSKLVMNYELFGLCPSVDKHCFPVFIKHLSTTSKKEKVLNSILVTLYKTKSFEKEEAHKKNIESISKSSEFVNKGGLVMIFPEGRSDDTHWKSGVGWLMNNINIKDAYYIYIHTKSNILDYLRFVFHLGRLFPSFAVNFSNAQKIIDLKEKNLDPKETAIFLENEYKDWVNKINYSLVQKKAGYSPA